MNEQKNIVIKEQTAVQAANPNPAELLAIAVQQGVDIDKLEKLMEMQERWEKNEARKAYHQAVAAFKSVTVIVTKDKINKQYNSHYSSIENMVNTVNKELSPFDLSASWTFNQDNEIQVTCVLSHKLGHSEKVTLKGPPDTSGSKNTLQQIKSTLTYLKLATYEAVIGIASSLVNVSDDGNSAGEKAISQEQLENMLALMTEVGANEDQFKKICKVDDLAHLPVSKYAGAMKRLEAKRDNS